MPSDGAKSSACSPPAPTPSSNPTSTAWVCPASPATSPVSTSATKTSAPTPPFEALMVQIREEIGFAVERVMTAEPDYMVMGMSSETFWGGVEGNRQFQQRIMDLSGLQVATGAEACERSLNNFNAKRIGVVTPYQPVGDQNVRRFFSELGFEVEELVGLRCPTAVSIAHVQEDELRQALIKVNSDRVDALVQAGTNLSMVALADEAERWLQKPVIAINAATWWLSLRNNGIEDKLYGCTRLLREF